MTMGPKIFTTTLNAIGVRDDLPCKASWEKLLAFLGKTQADDNPLPFATIVRALGFCDALWITSSAPQYDREWRVFAVWCVRRVAHLMTDQRSRYALDVAERHASGLASKKELKNAVKDAFSAALASDATARGDTASDVAYAAAFATASGTASYAAYAAAKAAARAAAHDAYTAAYARERAAQKAQFLKVVGGMA